VDKPIVRMFVGEFGTVRWETRVKGKKGLQLEVKGPREVTTAHEFADPLALVEYQSSAERRLLNTGYEVLPTAERRLGKDRRGKGRRAKGRRKEDRESE
jgi:hypothetical protein